MCRWNWGDITQIVQSICAVLNVLLLIYFTRKEWKNTKDIREQEGQEKGRNLERIWYEKLVMEKVVNVIVNYYTDLQKDLELKKNENRQLYCRRVKSNFDECKHAIVPYLNVFSGSFSRDIIYIMQNSVDIIMNEMDKDTLFFSTQSKMKIESDLVVIMKKLYEYDIK